MIMCMILSSHIYVIHVYAFIILYEYESMYENIYVYLYKAMVFRYNLFLYLCMQNLYKKTTFDLHILLYIH